MSTKWLGRRTQIGLHVTLALTPFIVLPLHLPVGWEPPAQSSPVLWILGMLSIAVGLPFFVLSASTPVLQRWFADSGDTSSTDPYFLYAASNAGSLVGLLGYPLLLEPALRLSVQNRLWSYGYGLFVVMTLICAALIWRQPSNVDVVDETPVEPEDRQRLRWIALAFVPSSLMLGVTTALTTDVPAIPLFWVLPLAIYLMSFVLVFAKRPPISHHWLIRRLPFLILIALIPTVSKTELPMLALLVMCLLTLFAVAMVCHGELARSRPQVRRLTEFYLWISFGGVLGGIFNSLVAPVIFSTVVEFPIALILAALLRPPIDVEPAASPAQAAKAKRNDWLLPLALGVVMLAIITGMAHFRVKPSRSLNILFFGYSMVWCMSFGKRPLRFAAGVTALVAASFFYTGPFGQLLHTERSFFGVLRVANDQDGKLRNLFHGVISHGIQSLDPVKSREPLAYYTRSGPAGSIVESMQTKTLYGNGGEIRKANWAVVGLGAGAMACYAQPGESLTYYEIDPSVNRIASNPRYFTFLQQCAPHAPVILGDARLKLHDAKDGGYDLLVLDAFSGDSIPMHLMTREALALYLRKVTPGGMLAFHISSLYLQLVPTLGALANDAGLVCVLGDDTGVTEAQIDAGQLPSKWVVMARSRADLGQIGKEARWVAVQPGAKVWTDDYSNLLTIIKWN
jgi:hypothetical protein